MSHLLPEEYAVIIERLSVDDFSIASKDEEKKLEDLIGLGIVAKTKPKSLT